MTDALAPFDMHRAAALLAVVPDALAAEVRALGRDGARWRPRPDEWSVAEVVGHLIEAERRGFAGRIREILRSQDPALSPWDQAAVSTARDDRAADPALLVSELRTMRLDGIALVRTLTPADLARSGVHPVVGPLRVDELVAEWVHHDRCHLRQALGSAEAWAWRQMGATRGFSDPAFRPPPSTA